MNLELHLDSREAFFLFRMIGMEEVKGFENPYKGCTVEQIDQEWEKVKTTLIEDGVLKETDGKLTIEPDTMYFLEICKFNDVVVKLEIQSEEQDIDVYHYISLEKAEFMILEGKRISASKSTYTFTITEGLNEYINTMGRWLDDTETEFIHMKARIQVATYDQLNEMSSSFLIGNLKKFLIEKEEVTKEFAEAFTLSLKEHECLGRCTVFSSKDGKHNRKKIRFLVGRGYNWFMIEKQNELEVCNLKDTVFLERLFFETTGVTMTVASKYMMKDRVRIGVSNAWSKVTGWFK
ncbi:hypothetical protein U2I54_07470 [Bacillus pseudomycoides]|uniref:Uncharacterized protein n=1 Tax=Bacillus bingmayongensis TaxID=1150157 RepID=A0ABU5JU29_9BACI|nr:hypothetical protein [Bacillus pseudomycoides]